jgi:hypothetical protein
MLLRSFASSRMITVQLSGGEQTVAIARAIATASLPVMNQRCAGHRYSRYRGAERQYATRNPTSSSRIMPVSGCSHRVRSSRMGKFPGYKRMNRQPSALSHSPMHSLDRALSRCQAVWAQSLAIAFGIGGGVATFMLAWFIVAGWLQPRITNVTDLPTHCCCDCAPKTGHRSGGSTRCRGG